MSEIRVLNLEEEAMLLKYLADNIEGPTFLSSWKKRRNLTAVLMMLDAGLRVGELVQLRYRDCYFAMEPVKVLKVRPEIAKRRVERVIPLSERLIEALARFTPQHLLVESFPLTQKLISRTREGQGVTTRGIEKMLKNIGRAALNMKLNPHLLRHTFATKLMRITDLRTVQLLLGHKHVSSTQIYTHPNSEDLRTAIQKMNNGGACTPEQQGEIDRNSPEELKRIEDNLRKIEQHS